MKVSNDDVLLSCPPVWSKKWKCYYSPGVRRVALCLSSLLLFLTVANCVIMLLQNLQIPMFTWKAALFVSPPHPTFWWDKNCQVPLECEDVLQSQTLKRKTKAPLGTVLATLCDSDSSCFLVLRTAACQPEQPTSSGRTTGGFSDDKIKPNCCILWHSLAGISF